jgi:hypothetical protein
LGHALPGQGEVYGARELAIELWMYLGSLEKGICQSLARLQVRLIVLKQ